MNIRFATQEELALVCKHLAQIDPWLTLDITSQKLLVACIQDSQRLKYVLAGNSELIGTVMFRTSDAFSYLAARGGSAALHKHFNVKSDDELPQSAYINILGVFSGNQGKSYGSKLLDFAETECAQHSAQVCLCVSDFNIAAQRFYLRQGYSKIGRIPDFVKPGYSEVVMWKLLRK